ANGKLKRAARLMYFDENVTKGFDWGYEGKTFTGVKSKMEVFTHILENNIGESYQVQSLPKNEMETMIVPVGITADAGKITFSAEATNLPNGLKVFLEDRENGTFTRLDETNTDYTVTLTEKTDGVGRFYLHTKSSALSTESFKMDNISMYPTNTTNLRIVGLSQGKANIKLFNILGKQVVNKSFSSNGAYDVTLPKLTTGVYIAQLENENGKISKKIILE
uniref:T9SS type A sorting domain-containing protein n=1 Tax=Polaribacter sp. TaxID=1920175 RepID=UPI003F6B95B4